MRRRIAFLLPAAVLALLLPTAAHADPCGMVPPIYTGLGSPITRVGAQKTYVFFKDGVESFVIRPGFEGKVDQFGMLIPFPSVPAIRKMPDEVFPHIAAAIDPPEVFVDLIPYRQVWAAGQLSAQFKYKNADGDKLAFDTVKVLKQEAVGMYEVAVLAAGSPKALKKWLDDHQYQYPKGMDKPCQDYVDARWCFVAVKTKVGQKKGIKPRPGQRNVNSKLPSGATFDGNVQAMGFRFKTDKLVVPMRLSAFNDGRLRNIVYLLTDSPRKIRSIPEEYVVRQITGTDLHRNVTGPLPLRIIGGTEADIPQWRRKNLAKERDPKPHNGAARDLFASDLLAVRSGSLALAHEEREKELLAIGERFGLRGKEIDSLNGKALEGEREKTAAAGLADIKKKMTLTVVDGDFPREVLAQQNLAFDEYRMPARRNRAEVYDAKANGPGGKRQGVLKLGALAPPDSEVGHVAEQAFVWPVLGLVGVIFIGAAVSFRRTRRLIFNSARQP